MYGATRVHRSSSRAAQHKANLETKGARLANACLLAAHRPHNAPAHNLSVSYSVALSPLLSFPPRKVSLCSAEPTHANPVVFLTPAKTAEMARASNPKWKRRPIMAKCVCSRVAAERVAKDSDKTERNELKAGRKGDREAETLTKKQMIDER